MQLYCSQSPVCLLIVFLHTWNEAVYLKQWLTNIVLNTIINNNNLKKNICIFCFLPVESFPDSKTLLSSTGEESLTIFLDKQKLNKKSEGSSNSSVVSLELLHQLAASYFTDRESTLRRLHHLQIATSAIKVTSRCMPVARCQSFKYEHRPAFAFRQCWEVSISVSQLHVDVCFVVRRFHKQPPVLADVDTLALA